jgi:threonine synthase
LATNENNVLDEFFRTGTYRVRASAETFETSSPSMDISKASNFERFIFDLLNRDGAEVARLFGPELNQRGAFSLPTETVQRLSQFGFASGASSHQNRLDTIRSTWEQHHIMIDPHTADGLRVAMLHLEPGVPMIVLETALPVKFEQTIVEATGRSVPRPESLKGLEDLPKRFVVMPVDTAQVKAYVAAHDGH